MLFECSVFMKANRIHSLASGASVNEPMVEALETIG